MTRDVGDVTPRKRGLRFEKSQLVEFLPGIKKVDFHGPSWPDEFVRYGRRAFVGFESWLCKSSQHRRIVSLSPYVEKPFNSKVIKNFVPELRSRKCFLCFGIPMLYMYELWTFYVYFTYPYICLLWTLRLSRKQDDSLERQSDSSESWSDILERQEF